MPPLFRGSTAWKIKFDNETFTPEDARSSFSGHERNHLFVNHGGERFSDLSTVSGLDADRDGRAFVIWDYDRDGRQDIALVNANAPLLNLYRNEIGGANRMIALRFVGANHTDQPAQEAACRDGYGAVAEVALGDMTLKREHRCGEGYAAQNSRTMIVGIGRHQKAQHVQIRWPSGKTTRIEDVAAGTLLTCFEDEATSPRAASFHQESYLADASSTSSAAPPRHLTRFASDPAPDAGSRLRLLMTMATWCVACSERKPQLELLRSRFDPAELALFGLPVDPSDTRAKLGAYMNQFTPPYELLYDLTSRQRREVEQLLSETGHEETIPSSIVIDGSGAVLRVFPGVPTVSEVRVLLREEEGEN